MSYSNTSSPNQVSSHQNYVSLKKNSLRSLCSMFKYYRFSQRVADKSSQYKIQHCKCPAMPCLFGPRRPVPTEMKIPKIWSLCLTYHGEAILVHLLIIQCLPILEPMAKITTMQKSNRQPLFIVMMKKWLSNRNQPLPLQPQPLQRPRIERMAKIEHFSRRSILWYSSKTLLKSSKISLIFWDFSFQNMGL